MKKFTYRAKSDQGKYVNGKIEARDERAAVELLRNRKMFVIDIKPQLEGGGLPILSGMIKRVKNKEVVTFTRQMSTMITAGLQLTNSLAILEQQSEPTMAQVISQVLRDVEGGSTLAKAMARHPTVFSDVYVALVQVGEAAGVLDKVLARLATNLEKGQEFRSKIRGAMVYPSIVMTGMVAVAGIMMIFVIPKLAEMYQDFGAELPVATKVLIGASEFTVKFWFAFLALGALGIFAFRAWSKTINGRKQLDSFLLRLPIVGPLKTQVVLTEFTRTMGLMVSAGISILEGLNIVKKALGNAIYEQSITTVAKSVEKGFPLATAMSQDPNFPPVVSQMISVGEETGKLDEVLDKLSKYFEMESEQKIKALTTAIEPLIMVVLGVGVGFLVISVIMPIYNLTSQF